jgi:2-aminoadipate transaminase
MAKRESADERIDRVQRAAAEHPRIVSLAGGLPSSELFPRVELTRAFEAVASEPKCSGLQYGWPEGDLLLRRWIAARLRDRSADVDADDVVVTNGAQEAIAVAFERLGGDVVAVDPVSYPAALELFRANSRAPGPEGPLVSFDAPFAFAYVMPGVGNPRGDPMSEQVRSQLLASGRPIIADEAYAELRFDGALPRPLLADARDRVWQVGTFSKTLCPGLRLGWLVPPREHKDGALRAERDRDLQAGSLAQALVRRFLDEDDFDARLARTRAFYAERAERLVAALRRRLPSWRFSEPEGGFSVFVETDLEGDDADFLEVAAAHGVSFDPGRLFRRDPTAQQPISLRLCYSNAPREHLADGIRSLARAARAYRRRSPRDRRAPGGPCDEAREDGVPSGFGGADDRATSSRAPPSGRPPCRPASPS